MHESASVHHPKVIELVELLAGWQLKETTIRKTGYGDALDVALGGARPLVERVPEAGVVGNLTLRYQPTKDGKAALAYHRLTAGSPPDPSEQPSTDSQSDEQPIQPTAEPCEEPAGMTWQAAAARMEQLRSQGEPWTSQHAMANRFGCSSATIHKAIKNSPSLQVWTRKQTAPRAVGQARSEDTYGAVANNARGREPDPADQVRIREYLERDNLTDRDRAFFNGLPNQEAQLDFLDNLEVLEAAQAADRSRKLYPRP